ncbi:unnamed protein product [Symbiodinium sp. CCMP2592]|nr:unnamed protein product [Symbiodinium sp. CCMP2592]
MISYAVLLTGLVTLGLGVPLAGAECIDCDSHEETVLLQRMKSSEDHTALGADEWRWQKHGYPKWNCEDDVRAAQQDWRGAILDISAAYRENTSSGEFVTVAIDAIENLYGYDIGPVTFKPTLAEEEPFRPTFDGALSYFVGYDAMQAFNGGGGIPEDKGFAIAGGDTWSKVLFFNDQISCVGDVALAQGYYYFKNATSGVETGVEYTFAYKKMWEGELKIVTAPSGPELSGTGPSPAPDLIQEGQTGAASIKARAWPMKPWPMKPVWWRGRGFKRSYSGPSCEDRVAAAQEEWKDAILSISAAYQQGGTNSSYEQIAVDAISKLYNYGESKVLFKPTLAIEDPFRETFSGAASYFLGYNATEEQGGFPEDKGFAINAGKTWSAVEFVNNQTTCVGDVALAQGYYFFTDNVTGNETGVEYTFAYEKKKTGELKIIAHHSSLPASYGR